MFRLLFLVNGWTDCVEIWYVIGIPLAAVHAFVTGEISLHMRTCAPLFHISGPAGRIVLKFGGCLGTQYSYSFYASHRLGASVRAHVHTQSPYLRNRLADCAKI